MINNLIVNTKPYDMDLLNENLQNHPIHKKIIMQLYFWFVIMADIKLID